MARKKSQKALQRELIDDYITSYQNQMQKQAEEEQAKNYAPAITNSGMSKEDIDGIINSYKPQTQEIPKLEEQNTTPSTNPSTPSISEELERMRKAKADTTTPRTEGEQKAIDTYYNSLLEASGKSAPKAPQIDTPTTDYRAELERARAMKADTSTARTEGENKAIDTYITSLEEAQRYLDSQKPKKNIGTVQVKADGTKTYTKNMSDKEQKEYKSKLIQNAKEVGQWAKENATPRGRALSPNEQRDLERAVNAVNGAQAKEVGKWAKENAVDRGRALSPNEQRDLERAQEAQKKAEENKAKVVKETMDMATSYAEKAPDNSLTVNTITKDATPTPTPTAGAQDLFKGYAQTMVDNGKQQELEQFVDEANDTLRKQQENILNPKIDDSKWLVKKDELDTLMQNPEFASDMETLRKATFDNANQDATVMPEYAEANFAPKAEGGMYSKSEYYKLLKDKYGLTPAQLNDVADTLQYYEREQEREQAAQDFQKIGQAHPLIGRLGSYAGTAGSGIEGMWNAGLATLTGDPRTQSHLFDTAKNELRTGVANSFNSDLMKNAYQIIAGLGDLGVGVAMGNAPLVLAGNTAGEATTNAIERGVDVNKAGLYGSLAGVTDYYFNKVGLDKAKDLAMDKLTKEGAKQFLKRMGVAGGIEGTENLLQDGVQMAFDELISGKNSENQISYAQKIASGETPEQAFLDVVKERALQFAGSFATGALMGAGMQAGTTALNVIPTLDPIHGRTPKGEIDTETLARINEDMQNTVAQKINDIPRMEVGDTVAPDARIPVMEEPENPFAGQKYEGKPIEPEPNKIPEEPVPEEPISETPSEPPLETRDIDSDDTNLSRVYTNTLAKNKVIDMANRTSIINAQYNVHHMDDVLDEARKRYTDDAERWDKAYSDGSMSIQSDADVATAMFLLEDKRARIEALQKNGGDKNEIAKLVTERDILARRLRAAGTEKGQAIKAFDYFNGTADGAIINAQRMYDQQAKKWAKKNPKKAEKLTQVADKLGEKIEKQKTSSLLSKALEQLGNDTKYTDEAVRQPKSFEQIRKEVEATLQREFASIDDQFTQEDIDFIAHMIEDKSEIGKTAKRYGMTVADVLADEIQHRLEHGEWYDYAGDEVPEKRFNSTLKSALNQTLETEPTKVEADLAKDSHKMIRRQVVDTLTSEFGSIEDMFDDADIDYLTNLIDSGATSKELADMLKTKLSTGIWDIPQETRDKVNNLFEQAQQFGENSKERVDLETEAFWELANCTNQKASLGDKFETWRYLAMLGNPKTHVRNIIGNKMFGAVTGVSNTIAAKMEEAYDKKHFKKTGEHIERTKAVLNKSDKGLVNRCGKDAFDNSYRALSGDKWHDSRGVQNAIKSQRDVFDSKALNKYNRLNNAALSGEDTLAMKNKYKTSLAGYLKANGFDESIFDDEVRYKEMISEMRRTKRPTNEQKALRDELSRKVEALEKGREYAVKQAEYAAFHEENKVADILSDLSRKLNTSDSWAARMIGKGFEGLLPFKKTPANILRSGFEYSPLNIIQDAVRAVKLKKGTGTAADLFESMGKTLTGDMLAVIGAFMYSQGMLNMEDDDTKWQGDLEGKQNYSVTIPIGKNKYTFTIDFLAPSAMPVFLGAQAMKLWDSNRRNPPGSFWDYFSQALKTTNELLSPIAETSMLQGINDTLESVAEGEGVDALGNLGTSVLTGYASQGIPTLVGQVARTIDPVRRSTYSSENEKIGRTFDKRMEKIQNKIPFLSMLNEPYLDAYGREQTNSPFNTGLAPIDYLGNFAYQSFIPSYVRKEEQTPADKSAWDIYNGVDADGEKIKDPAVFASIAPLSINGQRLSDEQNYLYTKTNGEANLAIRNALANSDWFNALSAPERLEIVKKVDTLTKNLGQYEVDPNSINVKGDLETFLNASQGYDANGFKTKDLQAGVDSFINSYEAQYNPYGLGNERYQEAKENEEDLTKFEGFKEALADAGLDYSKDAEDAFFGKTVDGSYFGKGAEAVKKYADYKNVLKENDIRSSKAVADAFTSGGVEGVNEYADRKQTAIDAGYVKKDGTANLDAYNKAFEVMGSAEGAKAYKDISTEIEDMGYTKQADYIPYLTEVAASDEEMGQILYLMNKPDEGSEADQAYNDFGYEGLAMYRQLQYMTPDYPSKKHPKGDGKIDTYDRIQQLYEWGYNNKSDEYDFFINSGFKYKK
jgi:hypothetical protein